MKQIILFIVIVILFASCSTAYQSSGSGILLGGGNISSELPITQSLFNDKNATISEENIQKILDGHYELPEVLRVALVKLESKQRQRNYYWTSEEYLKTQQSYLELFTDKFKNSQRVTTISVIPDLLISSNPTFVNIRESAVRTQADVVAIFSITSEIYSKYKVFSPDLIKAFATIEFILLDVRTGLMPFSTIVTKDYQSKKQKEDFDNSEAINRVKNEAVLLSINEVGEQLTKFLNSDNR
ncbi:MAG: hypothetical protein LBI82_05090 [Dysgonamonadaceae bacterium]|jgi:hypothetical protein|nr:hypothetical protein [Dysgonamonadaceae bacterium]